MECQITSILISRFSSMHAAAARQRQQRGPVRVCQRRDDGPMDSRHRPTYVRLFNKTFSQEEIEVMSPSIARKVGSPGTVQRRNQQVFHKFTDEFIMVLIRRMAMKDRYTGRRRVEH